ncbi:MAG: LamG-like jellyroll fold domain-containing protein [Terriglobales bacterium]
MTNSTYVAAQACTAPPENMVGWWPADGNATDIAGPNNGKLINGATFATGYVGKAFALNGSQYVDVKKAKPLDVSAGDFTVDAWVYFNSVGGLDQSIVDKMDDNLGLNANGWRLIYQGASDLFWFCLGGREGSNGCVLGNSTTVTSTNNVAAGNWYFVAGVKTSTQISIYVNGNLENTTQLGSFTDTNSTDLLFGAKNSRDMEGAYLNGLVDEVELFNRALAPSEISAIYNAGHSGKCKVETTLAPGKLTFAPQSVGTTSTPQSVTLKNMSPNGGVLNIASISTTGDFAQTNRCPSSLNPGQKCVIQLTFTPTAEGTLTGALSVTDNRPNGLPQQVKLTGTGQ